MKTSSPRRWLYHIDLSLVLGAACLLAPSVASAAPPVLAPKPLLVLAEHTGGVNGVAISPDGRTAATASSDKTIRFWDLMSGARVGIIRHTERLNAVAFSPDGRIVAVADRSPAVILFDTATFQEVKRLPKLDRQAMWLSFNGDGRILATIGNSASEVVLWNVAGANKRFTLKHGSGSVSNVAFSRDGKQAATCGTDEVVRFWDLGDGSQVAVGKGHNQAVNFVSYASDGKTAVTAGEDKTLKIWDTHTGKCLTTLEGHTGPVRWAALTPDGRSLLSLGLNDAQITVWDAANGKARGSFQWFRGAIRVPTYNSNLALTFDARKLLIGRNSEAVLFDLSTWLPASE